jgi:hypothetical protein
MVRDPGYNPPPTIVKCDNLNCTALYGVSNLLGGHAFRCNRCGSRVTVRDLSPATAHERVHTAQFGSKPNLKSSTPLLDKIVARSEQPRIPRWVLFLKNLKW